MNKCLNCENQTKNPKFCSLSCSATFNNHNKPKRELLGKCLNCNNKITSSRKFCSLKCKHFHKNKRIINLNTKLTCSKCHKTYEANNTNFKIIGKNKDYFNYYCKKCESTQTINRNRKLKLNSIEKLGGKCIICGYDRYAGALDFHHLDPSVKEKKKNQNWHNDDIELKKCILVCRNHHSEIHAGLHPQYLIA